MTFQTADVVALIVFLALWSGFSWYADGRLSGSKGVSRVMQGYRKRWMEEFMTRELRVIDTTIQNGMLSGVAFFASTSMLVVGGSLTVLGATDRALSIVQYLPFATPTSRTMWEIKVLLLVGIFVYSFFKFAWCYRLHMYAMILMGAAPLVKTLDKESKDFAHRTARIHGLAGKHFNQGLRAYMYGLAAIAWFVHPLFLIASCILVTWVLYRREFASRTLEIVSRG